MGVLRSADFLLSAEFTKVYAQAHGSAVPQAPAIPDKTATSKTVIPNAQGTAAVSASGKNDDAASNDAAVELGQSALELEQKVDEAWKRLMPRLAVLAVASTIGLLAEAGVARRKKRGRAGSGANSPRGRMTP